jgi:predicted metalloprotease with PDZ domain
MLLRAGLIDAPAYLDLLAESATRLQRTPGRHLQSLAESSFEAWTKYYQPDENSPNQVVSYYVKGALAALCLDLRLRRDSAVTLDDVMRALWRRHGAHAEPVPEGGLERLASELSGLELRSFFDRLLRSTEELPLAELLADFGVKAQLRAAAGPADEGGRVDAKAVGAAVLFGVQLRGGETTIATVLADTPAAQAGLAGGDQIVAVDELRVSASNWPKLLETLLPQRPVAAAAGEAALLPRRRAVAGGADTGAGAARYLDVYARGRGRGRTGAPPGVAGGALRRLSKPQTQAQTKPQTKAQTKPGKFPLSVRASMEIASYMIPMDTSSLAAPRRKLRPVLGGG